MSEFIEWLEEISERDSRVRAVLRRSLAFAPACFPQAYPYVEPFLKNEENTWRREMHYLVAGLWALHWRKGRTGEVMPIGTACADFDGEKRKKMSKDDRKKLTSTEQRFIALLDADRDQLPYRLRQMISLLKDFNLAFTELLWDSETKTGLLNWNNAHKRTQNQWARDFYRKIDSNNKPTTIKKEEKNENPD